MSDPMPAVYDALNWPKELRPKPHPFVVHNDAGAPLGIDWETLVQTELIRREGMGK